MQTGTTAGLFKQELVGKDRQVQEKLEDIQRRHQDIVKLEASINQLHTIFIEMATLVESQGEMLNSIETNVNQAQYSTEHGLKDLVKARELQKSSRKKMCCLVLIFLIIGAILAGVFSSNRFTSA